jgi:prevent-host-death family protein
LPDDRVAIRNGALCQENHAARKMGDYPGPRLLNSRLIESQNSRRSANPLALQIIDLLLTYFTGANIGPVNSSFGIVMGTKYSQDVVPLTDLKTNPGRVVKHVAEAHRPVLLTSRGRGVAVVQSVSDYEQTEEERNFMRAVVEGLMDLEAGHEVSLAKARKRLGLK